MIYVIVYLSLKSGSSLTLNKFTSATMMPGEDEPMPRNSIGSIAKPYVNDAPTLPPTAHMHTRNAQYVIRAVMVLAIAAACVQLWLQSTSHHAS
jgi:hypothetical protein